MCRVINFTKGHFSLIVHTLLKRIIVSSVFLESRRRRLRRRQTKKKVIAHRYARVVVVVVVAQLFRAQSPLSSKGVVSQSSFQRVCVLCHKNVIKMKLIVVSIALSLRGSLFLSY